MRRANRPAAIALGNDNADEDGRLRYLTYRPLSNLPTPPPTYKEPVLYTAAAVAASASPVSDSQGDEELLQAKFRGRFSPLLARRYRLALRADGILSGPAIHLVNLIPSSASLATASVPLVQAMLSRADLPLETVALAVCVLDSLDSRFARAWRLCCPLLPDAVPKRHTLPVFQPQMPHIDSVRPELIILAALVIAAKFTQDPQQPTQFYCFCWGNAMWSHSQLNATERCIMESLNYRIMPLCDEDYLADAMVDMQLAACQRDFDDGREPSPPASVPGSDDDMFVPCHSPSGTVAAVEPPQPSMTGLLSPQFP
ncbi:hypothetical protein XA68_16893 [Ophiocordyceps unilateralis]|uniref:Uncharacterized protein n=1 Tax=Ophiocordyceps unilateralis TaxID=268505 RepID=A0A2A9P405_OPHUN|nr:hypothetical protein XA68_16893 [Ophiocordyceps unilateralis]